MVKPAYHRLCTIFVVSIIKKIQAYEYRRSTSDNVFTYFYF